MLYGDCLDSALHITVRDNDFKISKLLDEIKISVLIESTKNN